MHSKKHKSKLQGYVLIMAKNFKKMGKLHFVAETIKKHLSADAGCFNIF